MAMVCSAVILLDILFIAIIIYPPITEIYPFDIVYNFMKTII